MSSDRERLRLGMIIDNIDSAARYIGAMTFEDYAASDITIDAVERCLMRLTEAVIQIGADRMSEIAPSIPVHAMRGLGNAPRHEYDKIDMLTIYTTVKERLPGLRQDCLRALK